MKSSLKICVAVLAFVVAACSQTGNQIGTHLDLCCPGNFENYATYRLEVVDMPAFLRNYVDQEFQTAFLEKGMRRDDNAADLRVVLSYNHINLDAEQQQINPFERMESQSVELSYVAEIKVEVFDSRSNNQVWGGSISRIHHVRPGEYMHADRARPEFRSAFRELLADYPGN